MDFFFSRFEFFVDVNLTLRWINAEGDIGRTERAAKRKKETRRFSVGAGLFRGMGLTVNDVKRLMFSNYFDTAPLSTSIASFKPIL